MFSGMQAGLSAVLGLMDHVQLCSNYRLQSLQKRRNKEIPAQIWWHNNWDLLPFGYSALKRSSWRCASSLAFWLLACSRRFYHISMFLPISWSLSGVLLLVSVGDRSSSKNYAYVCLVQANQYSNQIHDHTLLAAHVFAKLLTYYCGSAGSFCW